MSHKPKFYVGDTVLHVNSGKEYVIVEGPEFNRLEATSAPAYAYRRTEGSKLKWNRDATEMEDGRFALVQRNEMTEKL